MLGTVACSGLAYGTANFTSALSVMVISEICVSADPLRASARPAYSYDTYYLQPCNVTGSTVPVFYLKWELSGAAVSATVHSLQHVPGRTRLFLGDAGGTTTLPVPRRVIELTSKTFPVSKFLSRNTTGAVLIAVIEAKELDWGI